MNSSLSQWQKMEQSEKSVFYTEHLLPFIVEKYELDTIPEEIIEPDVLISTVGTSIEPICLTYSLLRPKYLVLLHTKTTVEQADQIFDLFRLRPSIAKAHEIDETSPHRFYQKIKDIRKELKNDSKIVIDLTGGQKTMSAMAAMAGTVINGKLVYVRSERDKKAGFQIPGSERLEIIRNPYSLQGDQHIEEMISLFNSRQFKSCEMICNQIAERLDGDDRFRLLAVLAKGMFHRNNLDLSDALDFFEAFIKKSEEKECLNRYALNLKLMVTFLEPMSLVDRGSDIINHIIVSKSNEEAILPGIIFVFNLYSLAIEELKINNSPDTASLLFYRTFELFIQIVFAFEYKTKTKALKYSKLPLNEKEITDRVIGYYSKIYGVTNKKKNLSYDVGLLEGAAILKALDT